MPPPTSTDMNVLVMDAAAASPIPAHQLPQPRLAIAAHVALSYKDGGRGDCVGSGQLPLPPPTSTDINRLVRDAAAATPIPAHPLPPPRLTISALAALSDIDGGRGDGVGGGQFPLPPPTSTDVGRHMTYAPTAPIIPAHPLFPPRLAIAAHAALSDIDGGRGDGVGGAQLTLPPPTSTDLNGLVRGTAAASSIPAHPLPPPRLTMAEHAALSDIDGGCGDGVGGAQLPLPPPTSTDVGGRVTESAAASAIPAHLHPPPRRIIAARAALSDTRRRPLRRRWQQSATSAAADVDRRGRAHDRRCRHVPHLRLTASFPSGKHRRTCGVVFQPRRPRPEVGTTRRQRRPSSGRTTPRRLPQTLALAAARRARGRCTARTGPYL